MSLKYSQFNAKLEKTRDDLELKGIHVSDLMIFQSFEWFKDFIFDDSHPSNSFKDKFFTEEELEKYQDEICGDASDNYCNSDRLSYASDPDGAVIMAFLNKFVQVKQNVNYQFADYVLNKLGIFEGMDENPVAGLENFVSCKEEIDKESVSCTLKNEEIERE